MTHIQRSILGIGGLFLVGLVAYYGLFFGAPHFMARYLFPLSPLLAVLTVGLMMTLLLRVAPLMRSLRAGLLLIPLAALALVVGLNTRAYARTGLGSAYEHIQVKDWIAENVMDEEWVGAVQTGVAGFFHDRTVNLDGKVNPAALTAARQGRIPHYVVESPIRYLVDWQGIAEWVDLEPINHTFELILSDTHRNLAVLRRTSVAE